MYTKNSLRDNSKKGSGNIDKFLSSDFDQSDFNSFIEKDVENDKKVKANNWWKDEDESSETSSILLGTGKNFLKPKIKTPENDQIPEIVVQNDIESISDGDLRLDLNKSSDPSQTIYNETIKENESNRDNRFQHPMTFEGYTESGGYNKSESSAVGINPKINDRKPLYEAETLKSSASLLPVDESNENFQMSADFTKKEHLLSKVSLLDSFEDGRANKSSMRYEDFMSSAGASDNHIDNQMEANGYYKTSINPASGDSFNTQGITNVTDIMLGENTAAELAALHKTYEQTTKDSAEPTANSNIQMSEYVRDIPYDKSYPPEDMSANDIESSMNTKNFKKNFINFDAMEYEKASPTPSPRKKKAISKSNDNDFSHLEYHRSEGSQSRLSDHSEKKRTSRYSHVPSSGYGSKIVTPPSREVGKLSEVTSQRNKPNSKIGVKNALRNPPNRSKRDEIDNSKSNKRNRSKSSNFDKANRQLYNSDTFKIPQHPNERYEGNVGERYGLEEYHNPIDPKGNEWHEKWLQERILVKKLQSNAITQERDFKRQIESLTQQYERKISQLESQLARTRDQLTSLPDLNNRVLGPNVTTEDVERIKKDIKAQELIVSAYEKDNEKLREEMKVLKSRQKNNDNIESFENERLISQIASLKADLDSKEIELRNVRQMARDNKFAGSGVNNDFYQEEIAHLKSEIQQLNKKYLSSESEKQKAEMQLDRIAAETDKLTNHYSHELGVEKIEKEKLKESHKAEVDDLKRKIKWYLENQAILDRDAKKIKSKDEEIASLKRQLDAPGTIKISSNIRAKERTVDIARIKQLEEENLSLKEDLYSLVKGKNIGNVASKRTVQFLEDKIKSLEDDLENNANKENNSLRSLQQQFESTKHQYEQTIRDLELDLEHKSDKQHDLEKTTRIRDLKSTIEQLSAEIQKKNAVVNRLKLEMKKVLKDGQENQVKADKNIRRIEPDNRFEILKKEVREKDIEIQRLEIQNDYLKNNERLGHQPDHSNGVINQLELEAENSRLKSQIAHVTYELDKHKQVIDEIKEVSLRNERIIREDCQEEIRRCEEYHKEQLKNVQRDYIGRHSESESAALQSQVEVQKNYITHLQSQISNLAVKEKTYEAKVDELNEAKQQIQSLKSELFDLRLIWSNKPGLEMIDRLRSKIMLLEEKESLKGRQLDEYVQKVVKNSTRQYQDEVERWRAIVNQKNQNLLQVQSELNHLLGALEELRHQGISIPKMSSKFKLVSENN